MAIGAQFRTVPGTQTSAARVDGHVVVVDRPLGVAGGQGSGLNGGQLLAMAVGGCLSNDVRYVAAERGVEVEDVEVDVELEIEDARVTSATVSIRISGPADVDVPEIAARAIEVSTVLAAVRTGFPVDVTINP
jgi:organic hydroperoxide reductase OsmC/OhrA